MDEYLECLYSYLMENKFVELNDRTEYITLKNMRDHAEKALMGDLSEEQRALFHRHSGRGRGAGGAGQSGGAGGPGPLHRV